MIIGKVGDNLTNTLPRRWGISWDGTILGSLSCFVGRFSYIGEYFHLITDIVLSYNIFIDFFEYQILIQKDQNLIHG